MTTPAVEEIVINLVSAMEASSFGFFLPNAEKMHLWPGILPRLAAIDPTRARAAAEEASELRSAAKKIRPPGAVENFEFEKGSLDELFDKKNMKALRYHQAAARNAFSALKRC